MSMASELIIQTHNLSKFIQTKPIVYRMNLSIPKGSMFGLLGPNGAGKSTALKLLTGRIKATSGKVSILGLDPWKQRRDLFKLVGYLPQNPTQPPEKTVLQFMVLMARLKGYGRKEAYSEAREILAQVGLGRLENLNVMKLSGGQKQRLGFANALIGEPEILILDEPTASLDPEGRIYVMELIAEYAKSGNRTVVISSHILPEIQRMTNHIAILADGKVLAQGPMWELTNRVYDDDYEIQCSHPEQLLQKLIQAGYDAALENGTIYVSKINDLHSFWKEIPTTCSENGWELLSLKPSHDALEQVFLNYVRRPSMEEVMNA